MGEFVPKYAPQAESFSSMVETNNEAIASNVEELNSMCGKINISSDKEDALAFHVITLTTKAAAELEAKMETNVALAGAVTAAAQKFDDEDYEEFLAEEKRIAEELARQQAAAKKKADEAEEEKEEELTTTTTTQLKKPKNRVFDLIE